MKNLNKHIIVCDDCDVTSLLLKIILETNGYKVTTVFSGKEVLAEIDSQVFDLLLLDITMPGMDGYEVAHHIQQNRNLNSLPILLLSGHEEKTIREKCQAKVAGIIPKPVEMNILLEAVKKALPSNNYQQISLV
ncbi:response regulator [Nostoc sp. LEGE 06077]|uniref:response regulator n=1 Tax=Nostoc sp. LEGE 06077 TaxID=915325 RepID=UPI00187E8B48|nr:response regulator [Nostoc sp. LEGE 06077]MBE9205935.1 response regulator [Nostoc sp. LEGE 06077]